MDGKTISDALANFDDAILQKAIAPYDALYALMEAIVGAKLFTVMETDMDAGLAHRSFSSNPQEYPVSGSKPIARNHWFDIIFVEKKPFIANTILDITDVFPDHERIWSLGCGSVVNLPLIEEGEFVGTINLLHEEHFYTKERVARAVKYLTKSASIAYSKTKQKNA